MSMQKLFKAVDAMVGLDMPTAFDTSEFEDAFALEDELTLKKRKTIVVLESDINALKKSIKHVTLNQNDFPKCRRIVRTENQFKDIEPVGTHIPSTAPNISPHEVPDMRWDLEVLQMIRQGDKSDVDPDDQTAAASPRSHGNQTSSKVNDNCGNSLILPVQLMPFQVSRPTSYDGDVIDERELFMMLRGVRDDPLDNLIDNVPTNDILELIPGDVENKTIDDSSNTTAANSGSGGAINAISQSKPSTDEVASTADQQETQSTYGTKVESKQEREKKMLKDKAERLRKADIAGVDTATSIIQKSLGANKRNRVDIPQLRNRLRAVVSLLNHNENALRHKNTKMDLTDQELRCFHRPRLGKSTKHKPWHVFPDVQVRDQKVKHSSRQLLTAPADVFASRPLAYTDAEKQDLSLCYGEFVIVEYVEETPPVLLNPGMASALINYFRLDESVESEDTDKRSRSQIAHPRFGNKVESAAVSRLPRHLELLLQHRGERQTQDHASRIPKLSLGEAKVLGSDDASPFMGDCTVGQVLTSISNNLFRAPIVPHNVKLTDFLLVRMKSEDKSSLLFCIREIPRLFLCGQLEPQKIIPKPSKSMSKLQEAMLLLAAARFFKTPEAREGLDFRKVHETLLRFYRCKSAFNASAMKKLLKDKVAEEVVIGALMNIRKWYPRRVVEDDAHDDGMALEAKQFSVDELEKKFTPEDVCLQESCNSADRRLMDLGIPGDIELSKIRQWLERMKRLKSFRIDRAAQLKIMMDEIIKMKGSGNAQAKSMSKMLQFWVNELNILEEKVKIAQYIYDRVLMAPWNTSEAFVNCHLIRDGSGRLELAGQGDPSGCGEGFAFVRVHKQGSMGRKKTESLVGSAKDLRSLTRPEMHQMLKNFGYEEGAIVNLKRWDMVHVIRELSTKAVAEGKNIGVVGERFARGGLQVSNSFADGGVESYKKQCQEIWDRQMAFLNRSKRGNGAEMLDSSDAGTVGDENEDEDWTAEEREWDNFNEDSIEDLISKRAEEIVAEEREEIAKREEAQQKEELRELNSVKGMFTNPRIVTDSVANTKVDLPAHHVKVLVEGQSVAGNGHRVKSNMLHGWRPAKVVKQTVRVIRDDGTESLVVNYILSPSEVARVQREKIQKRDKRERLEGYGDNAFVTEFEEEEPQSKSSQNLSIKLKVNQSALEDASPESSRHYWNESEYKPAKSTSRSGGIHINHRLPHVQFSAKLERVLMDEWRKSQSQPFRYPVPESVVGYHDLIEQPICLSDIREKIVSFQYMSVDGCLADLELMVKNCEKFNGVQSAIAAAGRTLLESIKRELTHTLVHLGAAKDEFSVLENVIKKKYVLLNRPIYGHFVEARFKELLEDHAPRNVPAASFAQFANIASDSRSFVGAASDRSRMASSQRISAGASSSNRRGENSDSSSGEEEVVESGQL